MIQAGRNYYAVPQNQLVNVGGDVRPLYAILCGKDGDNRVVVPQNYRENISGDTRPVYGTAGVVEGQLAAGDVVVAIPQGYMANVGGDVRPVYAFTSCPPGSSSSSSSSSSSGSSSSGSSGSSSSSGFVLVPCCPNPIPETLHVSFPGISGCTCSCLSGGYVSGMSVPSGTYPITYNPNSGTWEYCLNLGSFCQFGGSYYGSCLFSITFTPCYTGANVQGSGAYSFVLSFSIIGCSGDCNNQGTVYNYTNLGEIGLNYTQSGLWTTASCSPPYWSGNTSQSGIQCTPGSPYAVTVTA